VSVVFARRVVCMLHDHDGANRPTIEQSSVKTSYIRSLVNKRNWINTKTSHTQKNS